MDIRAYIRDELRQDESMQPTEVAERIIGRLNDEQKVAALTVALPSLVRDMIVQTRRPAPTPAAPSPKAAHSWKRQAIRESWRRDLEAIYATGDGYKRLADFTVDDLDALASTLREQAAKSAAAAARVEQLADAARTAGVERLGDLDEDTLRVRLGGVA